MLLYIIFLLIFFLILILLFKTRSPFWKYQPVYHLYNPYNIFHWNPFIVNKDPIDEDKYFNKNIKCIDCNILSNHEKIYITNLIQNHFLKEKDIHYKPSQDELFASFQSHNKKCFISLFYDNEKIIEEKKMHYSQDKKLVGVISSRPVYIDFFKKHNGNIKVYYVDHLCVHNNYRNQKIAPQLIQSHERCRRKIIPSYRISLFRRDISLSNIMPFTSFNCHVFETNYWNYPIKTIPSLQIVLITNNNIHILYDFLKENKSLFECVITPDISHVLYLIKNNYVHIYVGIINNKTIGCYFFRNSFTLFKNRIAFECFGSIFSPNYDINDNINALEHASFDCAKNTKCGTMLYDNISHNKAYIDYIKKKYSESYNYPCAYYFYNFIIHPKPSNEIFIFH